MKFISLSFMVTILLSSAQSDSTIDTEIEQVMNAKGSERYELMNQLKIKLATMNENERSEALQKLLSTMKVEPGGNIGSGFMPQTPPSFNQQMNSNSPLQNHTTSNNPQNRHSK